MAGSVVVRLLGSDPATLFLGGRLDQPLGYINGLAAFFVLVFWLAAPLAEHRRALPAAVGAAAMTLLAGLVVLAQSRGAGLALLLSAALVLAVVPGRRRRAGVLLIVGACVAGAAPRLLDVYDAARPTVPAGVARHCDHPAASDGAPRRGGDRGAEAGRSRHWMRAGRRPDLACERRAASRSAPSRSSGCARPSPRVGGSPTRRGPNGMRSCTSRRAAMPPAPTPAARA